MTGLPELRDPEDAAVLAYLSRQWEDALRLTTIQQAREALGLPCDRARRLELGEFLRRHEDSHLAMKRWGALAFALTEDEKLLARYLEWQARDRHGRVPLSAGATALGESESVVVAALESLERLHVLASGRVDLQEIVYEFAADHRTLAGPLGWTYHTVTLANGERFNVPCAIDFLLLIGDEYADQRVVIDDSCAHCTDRIRIETDGGVLTEVEPGEAVVFRGGG
jgi:hypothetical protein